MNKTGQRPCDADIEERHLVDHNAFHLDDCAECAERRERKGNEIGERRRDAVPPAHKIVPHLMGEQYRHNGDTVQGSSYKNR